MIRHMACLSVILLAGSTLRAGELDSEYGAATAKIATPTVLKSADATSSALAVVEKPGVGKASELDAESPDQSFFHFRHGFGGFGRGFGFGGFGRGFGFGGFGRGFGFG